MSNIQVLGKIIDQQTRCIHYHSELDIVAIKFACCQQFYGCYFCHKETTNHQAKVWQADELAILCGNCRQLIGISSYLKNSFCGNCQAKFNPNCKYHYHLYFDSKLINQQV